jgi:hypothetical protein
MLSGTTPSVDMTGGPWFTDNELDVEFVNSLKTVLEAYLKKHVGSSSLHLLLTRYISDAF